ncbi:thymidylate kinase-like [Mya arenaria]|uniref:thymidylate kinase-like n=1 Tax=Mya arenaria TaxID=6604 RepID=UPI0022E408DE|nr:thymidylate kinase-like [Mya arenaria]
MSLFVSRNVISILRRPIVAEKFRISLAEYSKRWLVNLVMESGDSASRGALIVIEGCDRGGKTTQCGLLHKNLTQNGKNVQLMKFPDRTTVIGKMINDYLTCKKEVDDHAVHLLFSANRWERLPMMLELLRSGTSVIVDRYAYSGVCYTAAKEGFDMGWCRQPDIGLPRPDLVVYLTLSNEAASRRGHYGEERYEQTNFQARVAENFNTIKEDGWEVVDADKSIDDLQMELLSLCTDTIEKSAKKPIYKLWTKGTYNEVKPKDISGDV